MPNRFNRTVVRERREYNTWVANATIEDYALRYTPKSFRKWSEFLVANTALGGISFLALEAIGGSLLLSYGFTNSFWAIVVAGTVIFLAGLPIVYYAAKYNIDMDLLTRGAGFGYIGSTITSLIYASFTFIFFALEAAIMAQALELYFHLPLSLGYLLCSLIIIPVVFYGITLISQLQLWTQPIWLLLMVSPYVFVLSKEPRSFENWIHYAGSVFDNTPFNPLLFGTAATVSLALVAQLGEQVDYLRFLPDRVEENKYRWWLAVILAGPGWIVLGVAKQLGGGFLASLAIERGATLAEAKEPVRMYLAAFADIFANPGTALFVTTLFVIVSQIKINVTNAYAGSLAWSNFFSRLTHSHPGRAVWLVLNIAIALALMELGVFETLEAVLGLYSNVAIAWVGALVADLTVNKPLGLSPSYIEFKRAYLYNFNPVGFGSMAIASLVSILAFVGILGSYAQAYSAFLALGIAFLLSPAIAFLTQGKYYIARENTVRSTYASDSLIACCICEQGYEAEDTAYCPVYDGPICSLCCSLEANCHDACKPSTTSIDRMAAAVAEGLFQDKLPERVARRLVRFVGGFGFTSVVLGLILYLVYFYGVANTTNLAFEPEILAHLFIKLYAILCVLAGLAIWGWLLTQESQELAEQELDEQNLLLQQEIAERQKAELELQKLARELELRVEQRTLELSRTLQTLQRMQAQLVQTEKMSGLGQLVAGIAHEINNPVSFIYGNLNHAKNYLTDLLDLIATYERVYPNSKDEIELKRSEIDLEFIKEDTYKILSAMQAGANRIRDIILSLRNFSRLNESAIKKVDLHEGLDNALMLLGHRLQARAELAEVRAIREYGSLPPVECYAGQMNQVFMHVLANALDALEQKRRGEGKEGRESDGCQICIRTTVEGDRAIVRIRDNGVGMTPEVKQRIFDYLFTTKPVGRGTGLGMSICYQVVVERHGGTIACESEAGRGTEFAIAIPIRQSKPGESAIARFDPPADPQANFRANA